MASKHKGKYHVVIFLCHSCFYSTYTFVPYIISLFQLLYVVVLLGEDLLCWFERGFSQILHVLRATTRILLDTILEIVVRPLCDGNKCPSSWYLASSVSSLLSRIPLSPVQNFWSGVHASPFWTWLAFLKWTLAQLSRLSTIADPRTQYISKFLIRFSSFVYNSVLA